MLPSTPLRTDREGVGLSGESYSVRLRPSILRIINARSKSKKVTQSQYIIIVVNNDKRQNVFNGSFIFSLVQSINQFIN